MIPVIIGIPGLFVVTAIVLAVLSSKKKKEKDEIGSVMLKLASQVSVIVGGTIAIVFISIAFSNSTTVRLYENGYDIEKIAEDYSLKPEKGNYMGEPYIIITTNKFSKTKTMAYVVPGDYPPVMATGKEKDAVVDNFDKYRK